MTNHTSTNTNTSDRRGGRLGTIGFGAGIAATLVAGIAFAAATTNAALEPDESTFVPIEPCRLFDTRPGDDNVGDRNSPLGPDDTHTQQVTGTNGNCTIPGDATAVAMNATAVGATAPSFATFYPSGGTRPLSSNLNYVPGQAPTPNKIDVKVSPGGAIDIYNAFGSVHMLADVMGYYRDSGINELQTKVNDTYNKAQVDAMLADAAGGNVEIDSDFILGIVPQPLPKLGVGVEVMSVPVPPTFAGDIAATFSINVAQPNAGTTVTCGLDETSQQIDSFASMSWESPGATGDRAMISGTRHFAVDAGQIDGVYVTCRSSENDATTSNGIMTVTMVPDS